MPLSTRPAFAVLLCSAALVVPATGALAQTGASWDPQAILRAEQYVRPPAAIERIVLASRTDISFDTPNADRSWFLRTTGKERATVATFGLPHKYIGGLQVDERANRARSLTTSTRTGLVVVNPRTGETRTLQTPAGASISAEEFSPSGTRVAYIANFADASYAYVAEIASGRSTQVSRAPLLATLVTGLAWTADGKQLLAVLVPEGRGAAPTHGANGIEDGPQVRMTGGRAVPQPVHASLLEDPHDQALLTYHTTGQLAVLDVAKRTVKRVGAPAMIRSVDAAADAAHFRVTRMTEPFSYLVPVSSFGSVAELWDASGKVIAALQTTPLREEGRGGFGGPTAGAGAQDTGKRNIQWNPVGPGLVYLQSVFAPASGGDARPEIGRAHV